jgi:hypothetical protein
VVGSKNATRLFGYIWVIWRINHLTCLKAEFQLLLYRYRSLDTYFYMSESTLYLNWIAIQVGQQTIYASEDEPAGSRVQWHPSAHSIYIVKKGMKEIEVRIEREVQAVEVSILKISIDNSN